jgi:hypothetical protein
MSRRVDEKRLAKIEARASAATPGPWTRWIGNTSVHAGKVSENRPGTIRHRGPQVCEVDDMNLTAEEDGEQADTSYPLDPVADAEFIAHARTDVPDLVAALRDARAQLAAMQQHDAAPHKRRAPAPTPRRKR